MHEGLRATAAPQGGVFTRRQALMAGYSEKEVRRLSAPGGPWVSVRRGAYVARELYDALPARDRDLCLTDRAAHLLMDRPHLISHDSAARAWTLPLLRPDEDLVHITRFGVGGSRTLRGVKHHLTRVGLLDRTRVDDMAVTGLARTALDLAREHGSRTGVVAMDQVLRRGVGLDELERNLEMMWCWPGVTQARAAVAAADPGAETPGESLLRLLVVGLGLGPAVSQFPVLVGGRIFWIDLLVGCHAFEFDGYTKFLPVELGGSASRPASQVVWDEKVRQDLVAGEGLGFSRVVWADVLGPGRPAAEDRLRREYHRTQHRLGDRIPAHLAANAARLEPLRRERLRTAWVPPRSTWVL